MSQSQFSQVQLCKYGSPKIRSVDTGQAPGKSPLHIFYRANSFCLFDCSLGHCRFFAPKAIYCTEAVRQYFCRGRSMTTRALTAVYFLPALGHVLRGQNKSGLIARERERRVMYSCTTLDMYSERFCGSF